MKAPLHGARTVVKTGFDRSTIDTSAPAGRMSARQRRNARRFFVTAEFETAAWKAYVIKDNTSGLVPGESEWLVS